MLKEALQLIQETAQRARGVRPLDLSADRRVERFDVGGKIEAFDVPPVPRGHVVGSLADLIEYVSTATNAVVWYSHGKVVLILDDEDRRDHVMFPLAYSEQMMALLKIVESAPPPMSQRDLLLFLRLGLDVPDATVNLFRSLNWTDGKQLASNLGSGRESLGMQIQAECNGTDGLPGEVTVQIPVYREFGEREPWSVRLLIEIDVNTKTFLVCPGPGDLDAAIQAAQQSIGERLSRNLTCPVYYGAP